MGELICECGHAKTGHSYTGCGYWTWGRWCMCRRCEWVVPVKRCAHGNIDPHQVYEDAEFGFYIDPWPCPGAELEADNDE